MTISVLLLRLTITSNWLNWTCNVIILVLVTDSSILCILLFYSIVSKSPPKEVISWVFRKECCGNCLVECQWYCLESL